VDGDVPAPSEKDFACLIHLALHALRAR